MKKSILALLLSLLLLGSVKAQIGGKVYRDFNFNGAQDNLEPGVEGVIIQITTTTQNITLTTDANGIFTTNAITSGSFLLEIISKPSYLIAGINANSSHSLVFVRNAPITDIQIPLSNKRDYCAPQNDPTAFSVATNCYVYATANSGDVLVSFKYDAGIEAGQNTNFNESQVGTDYPMPSHLAIQSEIGPTWGLAYQRRTQTLFAGSFVKRHTSLYQGSNDNTGVIFTINVTNPAVPVPSVFLNLRDLGVNTGNNPIGFDTPAHNTSDYFNDVIAWDHIGKYGLGGLSFDDRGENLWVMNLYERKLLKIPVGVPPVAPTSVSQITQVDVPEPPGCPGEYRSFAVKYHDGRVYIGMVCTAESTRYFNADLAVSLLKAYVFSMDPDTLQFSLVLTVPLNYPRTKAAVPGNSVDCVTGEAIPPLGQGTAEWKPWARVVSENQLSSQCYYPQAILSDIEFPLPNQMILGIMDRYGHQSGNADPTANPQIGPVSGVAAGDILCAKLVGGVWELEDNGVCGSVLGRSWSSNTLNNKTGANTLSGPGGGEFFTDEYFGDVHTETSLGGLTAVPGIGEVMQVVYDPVSNGGTTHFRSGGTHRYSVVDGRNLEWFRIFNRNVQNTFGKVAGLGDLESLCLLPPIQIGNRVWKDINYDGIQDAGEPPVVGAGVGLYLYDPSLGPLFFDHTNPLQFTLTNSFGEWYFSNLNPSTAYVVALNMDTVRQIVSISPYTVLTPLNRGTNEQVDSDAVLRFNSAGQDFAIIDITTGIPGDIVQDLSFGFSTPNINGYVWRDLTGDGSRDVGEIVYSGVQVYLQDGSGVQVASTTTDANGFYFFDRVNSLSNYTVVIPLNTNNLNLINTATGATEDLTPTIYQRPTIPENVNSDGLRTNIPLANPSDVPQDSVIAHVVVLNQPSIDFVDFGFRPKISIGHRVFSDNNLNGLQDSGEPGIANVTLILLHNGVQVDQTTTQSDGTYSFNNVVPETNYTVAVSTLQGALNGYSPTSSFVGSDPALDSNGALNGTDSVANANIELVSVTTIDFGFIPQISLGTTVWRDANGNGLLDGGEVGIPNVIVVLRDTNLNQLATTTTDGSGNYLFSNIAPGQYVVTIDLSVPSLSGLIPTTPNAGLTGSSGERTLDIGGTTVIATQPTQPSLTINFGFISPIFISGVVWMDSNNDGIKQGTETVLTTTLVYLIDPVSGSVIETTNTDSNGRYTFTQDSASGDPRYNKAYTVQIADIPGVSPTSMSASPDPSVSSNAYTFNGHIVADAMVASTSLNDINFGLVNNLVISGQVWLDDNRDGRNDVTEQNLSGINVTLYRGNTPVDTTLTDTNGGYTFNNLQPNTNYTVTITGYPSNAGPSPYQAPGVPDEVSSDGILTSFLGTTTIIATVSTGTSPTPELSHVNFGLELSKSVGSYVWSDSNRDGYRDSIEPGIPGVTVYITDGTNPPLSTITGSDGSYLFTNLFTNTAYTVYILADSPALATRLLTTYQGSGIPQDRNSDGQPSVINGQNVYSAQVPTGDSNQLSIDFGFTPTREIGGEVWIDVNGNATLEDAEPNIANVQVVLRNADTGDILTTTTDLNGRYSFINLDPNVLYQVIVPQQQTQLNNLYPTEPAQPNSDPERSSYAFFNPTALNGQPGYVATVPPSPNSSYHINFGFYPEKNVGSFVFLDSNGDGISVGELGLPGLTVTLFNPTSGSVRTTQTTAEGYYEFIGLDPRALYQVIISLTQTFPTSPSASKYPTITDPQQTHPTTDSDGEVGLYNNNPAVLATVLPGVESQMYIDFGFLPVKNITSRVWVDNNGNGAYESTEPPVAGITVILYNPITGNSITTTTDSNGIFTFTNIDPTIPYQVIIRTDQTPLQTRGLTEQFANGVPPSLASAGRPDTFFGVGSFVADVPVGTQSRTDVNFGILPPKSIGKFVWVDTNGDGIQQPGEQGISGVTVILLNPTNNQTVSTTTNTQGFYSFQDVDPNVRYRVIVPMTQAPVLGFYPTQPIALNSNPDNDSDGRQDTYEGQPASVAIVEVGMTSQEHIDFGFLMPKSVGHYVWVDNNGNGLQNNGEPGIPNVTVHLVNQNDGSYITTKTDENGYYQFLGVNPNVPYQVAIPEDQPGIKYRVITPPYRSPSDQNSDAQPGSFNNSNAFVANILPGPQSENFIDFGFLPSKSIGSFVFLDSDGNGRQDTGEIGIGGVEVILVNPYTGEETRTSTSSVGEYIFSDVDTTVPYEVYIITSQPAVNNFYLTTPEAPGVFHQKNSDGYPTIYNGQPAARATVPLGTENQFFIDFGFLPQKTVSGILWEDSNSNGQRETSEAILANITVVLLNSATGQHIFTTTDSTGMYRFTNIDPFVSYSILVPEQMGLIGRLLTTYQKTGVPTDVNSDGQPGTYNNSLAFYAGVPVGSAGQTNIDFGFLPPFTIGHFVWVDLNANGRQDPGEVGIPRVEVLLYNTVTGSIVITETDNLGYYSFQNVDVNTGYEVVVNLNQSALTSYFMTRPFAPNTTTEDDSDGIPRSFNDTPSAIAYVSSSSASTSHIDFGFIPPKLVSGLVWIDTDGDGAYNTSEPTIGNVTVLIVNLESGEITITYTSPTGEYSFENLNPTVNYQIVIQPQPNLGNTTLTTPYAPGVPENINSDGQVGMYNGSSSFVVPISGFGNNEFIFFGFVPIVHGNEIGTYVWEDSNANGQRDSGEPGLFNVAVFLFNVNTSSVEDITLTDSDGSYHFVTESASNQYQVIILEQQPGTIGRGLTEFQKPGVPTEVNSDGQMGTFRGEPALVATATGLITDFGLLPRTNDICGTVWKDQNNNGQYDTNEVGYANVNLVLIDLQSGEQKTTTTDAVGHYCYTAVPVNRNFSIIIPTNQPPLISTSPSQFKSPGVPENLNSDGLPSSFNGTPAVIANVSSGETANFGFVPATNQPCILTTNLYYHLPKGLNPHYTHDSYVSGCDQCDKKHNSHKNNDDDDRHNNDDDDGHKHNDDDDDNLDCGVPVTLSVYSKGSGSCFKFLPANGVKVGKFDYFVVSLPNNPITPTSQIISATANGVDMMNIVSIQNWTAGANVCVRPGCSSFPPPQSHTLALNSGKIAVCLSCSNVVYSAKDVEICIDGVAPQQLQYAAVSLHASNLVGYCTRTIDAFGVLPRECNAKPSCSPLSGTVICEQVCKGKMPISVTTSVQDDESVCLNFKPTKGTRISQVKFLSFPPVSHNPLVTFGATIAEVTDGNGNDLTDRVWVDVYSGQGNVCAKRNFAGYKVNSGLHDEVREGDIVVCMPGSKHSHDDDEGCDVPAPLKVCFGGQGMTEADFEKAIVKLTADGVSGFCGIKTIKTVAVLQCPGNNKPHPHQDKEEDCDDDNNDDDDSKWSWKKGRNNDDDDDRKNNDDDDGKNSKNSKNKWLDDNDDDGKNSKNNKWLDDDNDDDDDSSNKKKASKSKNSKKNKSDDDEIDIEGAVKSALKKLLGKKNSKKQPINDDDDEEDCEEEENSSWEDDDKPTKKSNSKKSSWEDDDNDDDDKPTKKSNSNSKKLSWEDDDDKPKKSNKKGKKNRDDDVVKVKKVKVVESWEENDD